MGMNQREVDCSCYFNNM